MFLDKFTPCLDVVAHQYPKKLIKLVTLKLTLDSTIQFAQRIKKASNPMVVIMKVISFNDGIENRKLKRTRELESKRSQLQGYREDYDSALKTLKRQHFNKAAKLIMDIRVLELSSK